MTFWIRGWIWLFEHPRYLVLVMAPFLLGLSIVSPILYFSYPFLASFSEGLLAFLSGYLSEGFMQSFFGISVYWVLFFLLLMFLGMAGALIFYCLYIILCSPFYSLLVEGVLKEQGKLPDRPFTFGGWLRLTIKLLTVSLLKSLIFVAIGISAFLISFIPGLNFIVLIVAALIFAFDSMDYSFEVLGMSLNERFGYFGRNKDQFLKMSLSMGLTLLVPGLTFLSLPGAVVGAALMVKTDANPVRTNP